MIQTWNKQEIKRQRTKSSTVKPTTLNPMNIRNPPNHLNWDWRISSFTKGKEKKKTLTGTTLSSKLLFFLIAPVPQTHYVLKS